MPDPHHHQPQRDHPIGQHLAAGHWLQLPANDAGASVLPSLRMGMSQRQVNCVENQDLHTLADRPGLLRIA